MKQGNKWKDKNFVNWWLLERLHLQFSLIYCLDVKMCKIDLCDYITSGTWSVICFKLWGVHHYWGVLTIFSPLSLVLTDGEMESFTLRNKLKHSTSLFLCDYRPKYVVWKMLGTFIFQIISCVVFQTFFRFCKTEAVIYVR